MPTTDRKLRVFLCHSSADKPTVRELYQRLSAEGWIDPWLDKEKLLPGQEWELEIEQSVESADAVIVCLSKSSVEKEGYYQKEIKKVLDVSDQKPEGTIFIIPLRLDDCQPPHRLAKWQYVDYFPLNQREPSYQRLLQSLKMRNVKSLPEAKKPDTPKKQEEVRKIIAPKNRFDHHAALVPEQVSQASGGGVRFVVAKLQWGKDDIGYSLHVEPTSFSSAGMQTTDFLAYLGFKRESCSFVPHSQCYAAWVDSEFELSKFAGKFDEAFGVFEKGTRLLQSCAHILDQPEGWGYFTGKDSSRKSYKSRFGYTADGHTAIKSEELKKSEDDNFLYRMSWIVTASEKGWVFHYRVKNTINQQILSALRFLGLNKFKECPYFDFEECYWMFIQRENSDDTFINGTASIVHSGFGAHEKNFSPALQMLVQANDLVSPFGFHFLNS
ncbi:MAG: toll/interleukin-1 receptor domain-containing protein [Chloroflexota bacterium]